MHHFRVDSGVLHTGEGEVQVRRLFGEETRLGGGCGGGWLFAASYANYAKDGERGQGRARDIDSVGVGIEVGWREVQALIQEIEEVVGYYAFEEAVVEESNLDPEAIEFRAA